MVNITFAGTERSYTDNMNLQVYATDQNELCLEFNNGNVWQSLHLDRDTAIKLVKELRKEIGELTK